MLEALKQKSKFDQAERLTAHFLSLHSLDCISSEKCEFGLKQTGNLQLVAQNCSVNTYWHDTALHYSKYLNGLVQCYWAEYRPQKTR